MYNKRLWLNSESSEYTGSVVAFDGMVQHRYDKKESVPYYFLEIGDCHQKVRLHGANGGTREDFIAKMKLLESVIAEFIEHLENDVEYCL